MEPVLPLNSLSYLGHATVMIHLDGLNVLTDPVLGDRVLYLRRMGISGRKWLAQQPKPDIILLSHLHLDHLHLPTLRRLPKETPILLPRGAARWLRPLLPQPLVELAPGEEKTFGKVSITVTRAVHGNDPPKTVLDLAQGYFLKGSHTIYFPGDTDIFPEMEEMCEHGLDVALLPIWGWGPTLGVGHMDPERAAEALTHLCPRFVVPIHWASFRPLGPIWHFFTFLHRPGPDFVRFAAEYAPETCVHLLKPGEALILDDGSVIPCDKPPGDDVR